MGTCNGVQLVFELRGTLGGLWTWVTRTLLPEPSAVTPQDMQQQKAGLGSSAGTAEHAL